MKKIASFLAAGLCMTAAYAQTTYSIGISGGQLTLNSNAPLAQEELGSSKIEFMFDYSFLTDTTDASSVKTDRMILQLGAGFSKFASYTSMRADSLMRSATESEIVADPSRFVGGQTFSIFNNFPSGRITVTDRIATDWFRYEEPVPVFDWTLTKDTLEILGYKCHGAKCNFRGREYVAFYTDEIPVDGGPWKFSGLPGFIMEVHDVWNQYSFTCVGINSKSDRKITMAKVEYNKTTRQKFYKTLFKYDSNPISYLSTVSGINVNITTPDGSSKSNADKPQSLPFDYIERDWR